MSSRNRQLLLLAVLIVAFAVIIVRQLGSGLGADGGAAPGRARTPGRAAAAAGPVEIAELRLEALEHKPAVYQPGRDPFRFGPVEQKPPPRPERVVERRPAQSERRRERPATSSRPPSPKPPPVDFVYLGSFGVPGREIAVFSDGKEILNAFAGDVLQKEFVVRAIGYESADIGFVNFPDEPAKRLAVGG